jgi:hypothetical protein
MSGKKLMFVDHGLCVFPAKPATELQTDKHAVINDASVVSEGHKISSGMISCHNSLKSSKAHTVTGKFSVEFVKLEESKQNIAICRYLIHRGETQTRE